MSQKKKNTNGNSSTSGGSRERASPTANSLIAKIGSVGSVEGAPDNDGNRTSSITTREKLVYNCDRMGEHK